MLCQGAGRDDLKYPTEGRDMTGVCPADYWLTLIISPVSHWLHDLHQPVTSQSEDKVRYECSQQVTYVYPKKWYFPTTPSVSRRVTRWKSFWYHVAFLERVSVSVQFWNQKQVKCFRYKNLSPISDGQTCLCQEWVYRARWRSWCCRPVMCLDCEYF